MRGSWRPVVAFVAGMLSLTAWSLIYVHFRAIQYELFRHDPRSLFHFRTHPHIAVAWQGPAVPWVIAGLAAFALGVVLVVYAWLSALALAGRLRRAGEPAPVGRIDPRLGIGHRPGQ